MTPTAPFQAPIHALLEDEFHTWIVPCDSDVRALVACNRELALLDTEILYTFQLKLASSRVPRLYVVDTTWNSIDQTYLAKNDPDSYPRILMRYVSSQLGTVDPYVYILYGVDQSQLSTSFHEITGM